MSVEVEWQWCRLEDLAVIDWHQVISLRQAVFVVEQDCPYLDADNLDLNAWHLIGWSQEHTPLAYLRVVDPGSKYLEPSIGRVLTRLSHRGLGLGHEMMTGVMERIATQFPQQAVRISAQVHLQRFYNGFGFEPVGDGYDEDGIPHIEMLASVSCVSCVSCVTSEK